MAGMGPAARATGAGVPRAAGTGFDPLIADSLPPDPKLGRRPRRPRRLRRVFATVRPAYEPSHSARSDRHTSRRARDGPPAAAIGGTSRGGPDETHAHSSLKRSSFHGSASLL